MSQALLLFDLKRPPFIYYIIKNIFSTYRTKCGKILPYQRGRRVEVLQITYQKNDGCIIQRNRNTKLPYKIGETTSMGWKVLNIEYEYNNKYYPEYEYNKIIQKNKHKSIKKKQTIELCTKEIKAFIYCFISMIIINYLKMLLGI